MQDGGGLLKSPLDLSAQDPTPSIGSNSKDDNKNDNPMPVLSSPSTSNTNPWRAVLSILDVDVMADPTATKHSASASTARGAKRVSHFIPMAAEACLSKMGCGQETVEYAGLIVFIYHGWFGYSSMCRCDCWQAVKSAVHPHVIAGFLNWSTSKTSLRQTERDEEENLFERVEMKGGSHAICSRQKRVSNRWNDAIVDHRQDQSQEQ
jgi:hypothetical protein